MIRKKPALGLDAGVDFRLSEKIMLQLSLRSHFDQVARTLEPFKIDHLLSPALTTVKQLAMVAPPHVVQKPSFDSFQVPTPLAPVPIGWRFILPSALNVILNLRFVGVDAVNG